MDVRTLVGIAGQVKNKPRAILEIMSYAVARVDLSGAMIITEHTANISPANRSICAWI